MKESYYLFNKAIMVACIEGVLDWEIDLKPLVFKLKKQRDKDIKLQHKVKNRINYEA
jgi:hypothetical protein